MSRLFFFNTNRILAWLKRTKQCLHVVCLTAPMILMEQPARGHSRDLAKTCFFDAPNLRHIDALPTSCVRTRDGGTITCATIIQPTSSAPTVQQSESGKEYRIALYKLDRAGNQQWAKSYRSNGSNIGISICEALDGGYAVLNPSKERSGDFQFDRIDADGRYQWSSLPIGSSNQEGAFQIIATADKGFLMSGWSMGADGDIPYNYRMPIKPMQPADWVLVKVDSLGMKQWVTVLGTSGDEAFGRFVVTTDGAFYYAMGGTQTKDHDCVDSTRKALRFSGSSAYLFKIDAAGQKLWSKAYGVATPEQLYFDNRDSSIVAIGEGRNGFEFSGCLGNADMFAFKTDRNGKLIWTQLFGGPDNDVAVAISPDASLGGGYLVSGCARGSDGLTDAWSFELGRDGHIISEKYFGGPGNDVPAFIYGASDSTVVVGLTASTQFTEGSGSSSNVAGNDENKHMFVSTFVPKSERKGKATKRLEILKYAENCVMVTLPATGLPGNIQCLNAVGSTVWQQLTRPGQQRAYLSTTGWPHGTYTISWTSPSSTKVIATKVAIQ